MNTLPNDLLNCIAPHLKASELALLNLNDVSIDQEYLNTLRYKNRYRLAIKENNLNWINQYLPKYGDLLLRLYNYYKAGKNGQAIIECNSLASLYYYLEGLSIGQHCQLFFQYTQNLKCSNQAINGTWRGLSLFDDDTLKMIFLMNFEDQDFIVSTMKSWKQYEDIHLRYLAKYRKYQALEYFIDTCELQILSTDTILYLIANRGWGLLKNHEITFNTNSNMVWIGCLIGDLELLDFLEENSRGNFYVDLTTYMQDIPDEIYKHFKDRIPKITKECSACGQPQGIVFCKCGQRKLIPYKQSKPNQYTRRIMKELRPFFTDKFLVHLVDIIDSIQYKSWIEQIILKLVRYYIFNNQLETVRIILEIVFKIKNQQSFAIFSTLCDFIAVDINPESDACYNLLRYRSCTFEVFDSLDVMSLL